MSRLAPPSARSYADLVDQLDGMTDAVVAAPPSHSKVGMHQLQQALPQLAAMPSLQLLELL